jgi:hypothetical protein
VPPTTNHAFGLTATNFALKEVSEVHNVRRAPATYREVRQTGIMRSSIWETRRSEELMRFIVTILWLILIVFIILVFLNTPGIR